MNLRTIFSVNGPRIVLYVGKLYNFAHVVIALNYAGLGMLSPEFRVLSLFRVGIIYTPRPPAGVRKG